MLLARENVCAILRIIGATILFHLQRVCKYFRRCIHEAIQHHPSIRNEQVTKRGQIFRALVSHRRHVVDVSGVHPTLGRNDDVGVQNFHQNSISRVERTAGFEKVKRKDVRRRHAAVFHRRHAESASEKRPLFHQLFYEHWVRRVNRRHARTLEEGAREGEREKSERFVFFFFVVVIVI